MTMMPEQTPDQNQFDLQGLVDQHRGQGLDLIDQHINPAFAKVLRVLGYDVDYVRGQGAYLKMPTP